MKKITDLRKEDIEHIEIVCFDVDGVTIKKGTEIKEVRTLDDTTLTVKTSNLSPRLLKKMIELKKYYVIAISSGRSSLYLTKIFYELLWKNAALISEIGIFTLFEGELIQNEKFDDETLGIMRNIVVDLKKLEGKNKSFGSFEAKQFLITLHAYDEMQEVYDIVKKHDKNNQFYTIWNGEAFDIAPKRLNKGTALENLAKYLNIDIKNTMAIGNGPNDQDMIDAAGIGVTTEPKNVKGDYYTESLGHLGGEQLVDILLDINKK